MLPVGWGGRHHDRGVATLATWLLPSAAEYSSIFPTINKREREGEKRTECLDEEGKEAGGAKPEQKWGANNPSLW